MTRPIVRRTALATLAGAAASLVAAGPAMAQLRPAPVTTGLRPYGGPVGLRRVTLVSAHTGESFSDVFAVGSRPNGIAMARLSRLLRDHNAGVSKPMDPALIELMARIQTRVMQPIIVTSAYRSPFTNLRLHIAEPFGVPENSFHTRGKAIDFFVNGVPTTTLARIAREVGAGGIGVYASGFVHVDTGPVRDWTG
jgi:uncharacterized protein YcbK (DUF882 family)